jgi:hypothetical protein
VEPGATVSTDELYSYNLLTSDGFEHGRVSHGKGEYAVYDYRSGNTSTPTSWKASGGCSRLRFGQRMSRSAASSVQVSGVI